jgi:glycerophosphoryl diester phosphodiesterase
MIGTLADVVRTNLPKQLVAHRGASAYAPEHTLAAYRLALEQGADYVEQDLGVTKDGELICLHDDSLERTTDVEARFRDRATNDPASGAKRWLAADFTLAEIRQLDAGSWFGAQFAGERVPTWDEAVALIAGRAGLYPELKSPALYRARGIDMAKLFVEARRRRPIERADPQSQPPLILQSFDERVLRDLARLLPEVPRTLLIDTRDGARWFTPAGLRSAAEFATGIGPAKRLLDGRQELVRLAHEAGLTVTPYTFHASDPGRFTDVRTEMRYYLFDLGVDALFTDNPDQFPRE